MEGSMFYWIAWTLWVYLTFILKRDHANRLLLSASALIVIILADFQITIIGLKFHAGGLFLLIISYVSLYKMKRRFILYYFVSSMIVTIAYAAFRLFEIYDPAWLIFNEKLMIGVFIAYLAAILEKTLRGRFIIMISGTMQGEILFAYILKKYHFSFPIGSFEYLDVFSLTMVLLAGWSCIEAASVFFEKYVHSGQKVTKNHHK
jgi:hypothetical protein